MLLRKETTNILVALYLTLLHLFLTNVVSATIERAMIVFTKLLTKPRYKLILTNSIFYPLWINGYQTQYPA